MVEISPFKGITYNKEKIKQLDNVMSPPYDIISEQMQNDLYKKHAHNFVKLILGKQFPDDSDENNRYTRAKELFEEWQKKEILIPSKKSVIYPYKIDYMYNNKQKTMNGFFVLLKLDPQYTLVKAHERTLSKPKADRLNLMRACQANLEPIQLLYMDKDNKIQKKINSVLNAPLFEVIGYDGFTHKIWNLDNEDIITEITTQLNDEVFFIADGHHRYQTAINYADEMQEKTGNITQNAPFNYRMVILVNMFDTGLSILPTHRLIQLPEFNIPAFLSDLNDYFFIEKKEILSTDYNEIGKMILHDLKTNHEHKLALYYNRHYYILTLKDEKIMDSLAPDRSKTWRTLDVSILHKVILEKLLDINEHNLEDHVKYTRIDSEAIQLVDEGKFTFSFLMNATKIDELKAIADAGEHMPQKSTYFLPKMLSGLVMYKMN
jgi:uncharacterized protein (DUF1015 family)